MTPRLTISLSPDTFRRDGLLANQIATLDRVRELLSAGHAEVKVWGLSGTGKSVVASRLADANVRGLHIDDDGSEDLSHRRGAKVTFKRGIPLWKVEGTAPRNEVWHGPIPEKEFVNVVKGSLPNGGQHARIMDVASVVASIGLGSTVIVDRLPSNPSDALVRRSICQFFVKECLGQGVDFATAFDRISERPKPGSRRELRGAVRGMLATLAAADLQELFRDSFLADEFLSKIADYLFPGSSIPGAASETIEFYRSIDVRQTGWQSPAFLIRSSVPVSMPQQVLILSSIANAVKLVSNHWTDARVVESDGKVELTGWLARKTGLFLYRGRTGRIRRPSEPMINPDRDLLSLVEQSDLDGARIPVLYKGRRSYVERDCLIYAGRDHTLGDCQAQGRWCLALELILQKLHIPYEAWRGDWRAAPAFFAFDGKSITNTTSA